MTVYQVKMIRRSQPASSSRKVCLSTSRVILASILITIISLFLSNPPSVLAEENSDGTGIQVASWALSVPYAIGKGAFAIGGAVVGGLGYVFSGANSETAKAVWTKSIYGTYLIRPAHLRGEEPVRFLGQAGENQDEGTPPSHPAPQQAKSERK